MYTVILLYYGNSLNRDGLYPQLRLFAGEITALAAQC